MCGMRLMLRGKFQALNAYIRKAGKNANDLQFYHKKQNKTKTVKSAQSTREN